MIGGILKSVLFALIILILVGCDTSTNPTPDPEDAYFPLKEGNWWSIKQEDIYQNQLESFIDTCKADTNVLSPSLAIYNVGQWGHLAWDGGALFEIYSNGGRRILIPANKELGMRFNESETEYWTLSDPYGGSNTVEAGTFENCIVISMFRFVDGRWYQAKNDVYAKGVGRINTHIYYGWLEPPAELHQELTSYDTSN